ncbi:MAG: hypothetical protein WAN75_09445, partial [Xanthobacteraceae bacterium]
TGAAGEAGAGAGNPTWAGAGGAHKTARETAKGNTRPLPRSRFAITVQGIRKSSPHELGFTRVRHPKWPKSDISDFGRHPAR